MKRASISARPAAAGAVLALFAFGRGAQAQGSAGPYVPTPAVIVEELLKLAAPQKGEHLIDLGSGDGRIVITAAKLYGTVGSGVEIQESLVKLANEKAAAEGLADRVHFVTGDLFEADVSKADIVTVYLLPDTVTKLVPKLSRELKPGARVVSHDYPLEPWKPEQTLTFDFKEKIEITGTTRTVLYLYRIPPKLAPGTFF